MIRMWINNEIVLSASTVFFLVIVITLSIIGFSMMNFITRQAYDNTFSQLEGYADSMGHIALKKKTL